MNAEKEKPFPVTVKNLSDIKMKIASMIFPISFVFGLRELKSSGLSLNKEFSMLREPSVLSDSSTK